MKEVSTEYAIMLPGKGWLIHTMGGARYITTDPDFQGFVSLSDARSELANHRRHYENIGAEVVGNQLTIVTRTTTVTRTDWDDLDDPE